jgi:hypothetical protein
MDFPAIESGALMIAVGAVPIDTVLSTSRLDLGALHSL